MMRTAEALAAEAADCIDACGLTGEGLRLYLAAWIAECARSGDLDAFRRGLELANRRYDRHLERPTEPPPALCRRCGAPCETCARGPELGTRSPLER